MQTFHCKHTYHNGDSSRWDGSWDILERETDFHELRIRGRGSSYDVVLGECSSGNYLCIPASNIGCSLGHWTDTFWNFERLSSLMNETDAKTIITALYYYHSYC